MSGYGDRVWWRDIVAARTAFFLDCDGTLLDFKDRPEDVVADDALRALLQRLHDAAGGAVALVSGRTLADLDRIMQPLRFAAGGTHGAEIRFADGRIETKVGDAIDVVRKALVPFVNERDGLALEDKGAALAVHYRRVPHHRDEVVDFLDRAVTAPDLMVQHGKMVAEVKSSASDKGRAIAALIRSAPFAGRVPLFVGDDLTDERGFERVNASDGIAIKVGGPSEPTVARYRLADIEEVRKFLNDICRSGECH